MYAILPLDLSPTLTGLTCVAFPVIIDGMWHLPSSETCDSFSPQTLVDRRLIVAIPDRSGSAADSRSSVH